MAVFPPPPAPLLSLVERVINSVLQTDPVTNRKLQAHAGHAVAVHTADTGIELVMVIEPERIRVRTPDHALADCTLSANTAVFMQLAMQPGDRSLLFGSKMTVSGDLELAGAIADCLSDLEVDPGALFSPVFGDVAAQGIGQLLGNAAGWLRRTGTHLKADVEEYLENETDLPSRQEGKQLFATISDTRDAVERMSLRIQRLQKGLKEPDSAHEKAPLS